MTPALRRGGVVSAALHLAILLALILALPTREPLPNTDESAVSMEFEVAPAPVQRAPTPAPTPSPQQAQVPTPDLPSLETPKLTVPMPPPPPPPPPLPPLPTPPIPPAPAPATPPPPATALAPPAPVTLAPAPLAISPTQQPKPAPPPPLPTPPRPPTPPHPTTAPTAPATPAPRPAPQTPTPPAPTNSQRSQPHPTPNTADESRTLEATLEKLRSLQAQTQAPTARYNPPAGGRPGGGQLTGVDNAQLSAAVRGAIGDKLRECYDQDTGGRDYDKQSVRLRVTTDASGTIRDAQFAPGESGRTGVALVFAERARRAALSVRCATLPLPRDMLGANHTFEILFKP